MLIGLNLGVPGSFRQFPLSRPLFPRSFRAHHLTTALCRLKQQPAVAVLAPAIPSRRETKTSKGTRKLPTCGRRKGGGVVLPFPPCEKFLDNFSTQQQQHQEVLGANGDKTHRGLFDLFVLARRRPWSRTVPSKLSAAELICRSWS